MTRAIWNGKIIAEADDQDIEKVEGNVYFPPHTIIEEYFESSDHNSTCGWKGIASYYHIKVDGEINRNAAWYYPEPKDAAKQITGFIAFWKGVTVEE